MPRPTVGEFILACLCVAVVLLLIAVCMMMHESCEWLRTEQLPVGDGWVCRIF